MAVIFIDDDDGDDEEINIDDVQGCSDKDTLAHWFRSMMETGDRVRAHIEARRLADLAPDHWLERASAKVAYLRIGMKRVEERMLTLGLMVPYPPSDPRTRQAQKLEDKNRKLRALLKQHGIEIPPELDKAA